LFCGGPQSFDASFVIPLLSRGGGEVLFGTDVGYMTAYDPTEEYALMAKAGMTLLQILASLTAGPTERFGYRLPSINIGSTWS
jgi:imidazolonepropionase-like amidohydrolase